MAGKPVFPFSVEVAARQWQGVTECALIAIKGDVTLVIEGDPQQIEAWRIKAAKLNILSIRHVPSIPMDKRHASKIDQSALQRAIT